MNRTFIYPIGPENATAKIKHYLRGRGYSKQLLAQLANQPGSICVNDQPKYMSERLSGGDLLTVHICENKVSEKILPVKLPLDILYEDEDIIVVNKPAGMPTHPSLKNYDNSLANALAYYFKTQNKAFVFRCTNRLDRDTSGVTVISKHLLSSGILFNMAVRHEIDREYLAIVKGCDLPDTGRIAAPLGRKPGSIIERTIDFDHGESAVTHYKVLKKENGHSLVSIHLETGRTHQIRIHMKYIGYPLIGDYLYNPDMTLIGRQALHSYKMSFKHPINGKWMEFTAPMPADMEHIISMKKTAPKAFAAEI